MTTSLYHLLPNLYRSREVDHPSRPLERLMGVLQAELDLLDQGITDLLEAHFVERADPEALGELAALFGAVLMTRDPSVNRGIVARTVHWRRRRGTGETARDLAQIATGWGADVTETHPLIAVTQDLADLRPARGRTARLVQPVVLANRSAPPGAGWPLRSDPTIGDTLGADLRLDSIGGADRLEDSPVSHTLDLGGWARPEAVVVRLHPMVARRMVGTTPSQERPVTLPDAAGDGRGLHLDPQARDVGLVWNRPRLDQAPPLIEGIHEPEPPAPTSALDRPVVLSPSQLAAEPLLAEENGALELRLDGIPLVGAPRAQPPRELLFHEVVRHQPVLRLADPSRVGLGDRYRLTLLWRQGQTDRVLASTDATDDASLGPVLTTPHLRAEAGSAALFLRVQRTAGVVAMLDPQQVWQTASVPSGAVPTSSSVAWPDRGPSAVIRLGRASAGQERVVLTGQHGDASWGVEPASGSGAFQDGARLLKWGTALVSLVRMGSGFHVWIGKEAAGTWTFEKLALAPGDRPHHRDRFAACVVGDRLYLYGGVEDGPRSDFWSLDLASGTWDDLDDLGPARVDGTLVSFRQRLWLVGGGASPGNLDPTVWSSDPAGGDSSWRAEAPIPFEPCPGVVSATPRADTIQVVAWADRTTPTTWVYDEGWTETGPLSEPSPNPPEPADVAWTAAGLRLTRPSPLPASEVIASTGGGETLCFLPRLDLVPRAAGSPLDPTPPVTTDGHQDHRLGTDGTTWRFEPDTNASETGALLREGAGQRIGVVGRLRRVPYGLVQASLGTWAHPVRGLDASCVALDPRLGRVVLPPGLPGPTLHAWWACGRPAALGAGHLPAQHLLPTHWQRADPAESRTAHGSVVAWFSPDWRVQTDAPVVDNLQDAAATIQGGDVVVGIQGSPQAPAQRVDLVPGRRWVLTATDQGVPRLLADEDDQSLQFRDVAPGPTDVTVEGLWLDGSLDHQGRSGTLALHWCTIAGPGRLAVSFVGDDLMPGLVGSSPLEVVLIGCELGTVRLPSWVRLTAIGCTFDAATREALAIDGAGALVDLRHCTLRGGLRAGRAQVDNCAIAGAIQADDPGSSWLRYTVHETTAPPPPSFRSRAVKLSFEASTPADPGYLALARNNAEGVLQMGESNRTPGAHGLRHIRRAAAERRISDHLPLGMTTHALDQAHIDILRATRPHRSTP